VDKLDLIKSNKELVQYYDDFNKTVKKYINIKAKYSDQELPYTQSKFGGKPYLIDKEKYPYGTDGNPLKLLAQLNFTEIPHLNNFPEDGILQFYISFIDKLGLLGADFDNPTKQDLFRIIYIQGDVVDENTAIRDYQFPETGKDYYFPVTGEFKLDFKIIEELISYQDHRFSQTIGNRPHKLDISETTLDELYKITDSNVHKIGGYPHFTQWDPRDRDGYRDYDTLLFQITSQHTADNLNKPAEIMWGDMGVANFFIKSEKLIQRDFTDVLYNWDCF